MPSLRTHIVIMAWRMMPLRHVTQRLSRRGLHRPALEVAKLLLALDWHDPTGTLPCRCTYLPKCAVYLL